MFTSVFFLLNIVYFSVCLTSNKLYWIEDQVADVSTRFYTSASWTVGELTGYLTEVCALQFMNMLNPVFSADQDTSTDEGKTKEDEKEDEAAGMYITCLF